MSCVFNEVRHRLFGSVCLGGVILMLGGCASLVFDELSDMRSDSASNGGVLVSGAQFRGGSAQIVHGAVVDTQGRVVIAGATLDANMQDVGCDGVDKGGLDMFVTWVNPNDLTLQCPTSRLIGGTGSDVATGIAANPISGGVQVVGFSTGDFDCGNGGLMNNGGRDLVVASLGGDTCFWQQSFGDVGDQEGQAIAFDSVGAAYIGGKFKGTLMFDQPLANPVGFDAFVAKLPFGPTPSWSVQAGGDGDQEVQAIAVAANGTIIVGGRFSQSLNFVGQAPLNTENAANDALFVASLDSNGSCSFLTKIAEGPEEDASPMTLTVASDGDIFVAGGFRSRTLFPDEPKCKQVNDTQAEDAFVAKLNLKLECQWARRYGEIDSTVAEGQRAYAVAADAASNVYVTGEFKGSLSFGEKHTFQSLGNTDAFVLKLDNAGAYVWSHVIAGTGTEVGNAIVLDASGEFLFVAGSFADGPLDLGNGPLTPTGSDIFLAKLTR